MTETNTYLRTCTTCRIRFEPVLGRPHLDECRRCRGQVCPLCSGPTLEGRACSRDECQRVLRKAEEAAIREDRRRKKEERETLRFPGRRTA